MFGLEIATVGLLHLAATTREAKIEKAKAEAIKNIKCEPRHSLDIKIAPTQSPIKYNFSTSSEALGSIGASAYSPYGSEHKTNMLGLTDGKHELSLESSYSTETYEQLDRGCIHIKSITVKMNFDPTIYVVNEFPQGTCEFNSVLKHEKEHVKITQKMLNKYAKILGKNLKAALKDGYSYGPFYVNSLPSAQEKLGQKIMKMAITVNKKMAIEMEKHQNHFDRVEVNNDSLELCAKSKNSALRK
jgi:hypothetical protein